VLRTLFVMKQLSTSRLACRSDSPGTEESSGLFCDEAALHLAACMPLGFARHRRVLRTLFVMKQLSTSRLACRSDSPGTEESSGLFCDEAALHLAACMPLGFARHRRVLRTLFVMKQLS